MVNKTKDLLRMSKSEAKAEVEEAINKILEAVNNKLTDNEKRKQMYELILEDLKKSNERLWFNTSLRMGGIYMETNDMKNLNDMLLLLKTACKKADAASDDLLDVDVYDMSKGNHLLEVFALEIQMCIKTKETRRMKQIYNLTQKFSTIIEDPRIMGIIKECGGKMYMSEKRWDAALDEFNASFKSLVESGNSRAQTMLKYVILASILSQTEVDHLSTNEAKIYSQDNEIIGMTSLKSAV